jgi:transglutaminase-like putative cysteine protease
VSGAFERAEAAVRAAIVAAKGRCPAGATEWHAWAKAWLAGDRQAAQGAASSATTELRSARRLEVAADVDGCRDALNAAEAAISFLAAARFLREAERSAGNVAS